MSEQTLQEPKPKSIRLTTAVLLILPLLALGGVIALFLRTGGGLSFSSPVPLEDLTIERTVLNRTASTSWCATPGGKTSASPR